MARIRIELDHSGMDAMLKSRPVKEALQGKGQEVKDKAISLMSNHYTGPLNYRVDTDTGRTRALTWVRTSHMLGPALERKYAPLRNAVRAV